MPEKQEGILVFVYGTLKGGNTGRKLGDAETMKKFLLFDGKNFPVVMPLSKHATNSLYAGVITGELYEISLTELGFFDDYEGYPDFYDRMMIDVRLMEKEGDRMTTHIRKAWMYYGNGVSLQGRSLIVPDVNGRLVWD